MIEENNILLKARIAVENANSEKLERIINQER